jgi:phage terminase large subunit
MKTVKLKATPLFDEIRQHRDKRILAIHGGRGGSKSYAVADYLLFRAINAKEKVLCAREVQSSIADSVHSLLAARIAAHGLGDHFKITDMGIRTGQSEFIFKGLRDRDTAQAGASAEVNPGHHYRVGGRGPHHQQGKHGRAGADHPRGRFANHLHVQ